MLLGAGRCGSFWFNCGDVYSISKTPDKLSVRACKIGVVPRVPKWSLILAIALATAKEIVLEVECPLRGAGSVNRWALIMLLLNGPPE